MLTQTHARSIVIDAVVVGFGNVTPHEHNPADNGVGVLARWHDEHYGADVDVVAHARQGRAAYVDMTGLQPGDTIELTGRARLIECPPCLRPTVVLDVAHVRILTRAPQAWQRGTPA